MKNQLRIRVEIEREDHERTIVALERARVAERDARARLDEALNNLDKACKDARSPEVAA